MNWDKIQSQNRACKYGLEIDFTVGKDPNKLLKYGKHKSKKKNSPKTIIMSRAAIILNSTSTISSLSRLVESKDFTNNTQAISRATNELTSCIQRMSKLGNSDEITSLINRAKILLSRMRVRK